MSNVLFRSAEIFPCNLRVLQPGTVRLLGLFVVGVRFLCAAVEINPLIQRHRPLEKRNGVAFLVILHPPSFPADQPTLQIMNKFNVPAVALPGTYRARATQICGCPMALDRVISREILAE